MTSLAFYGHCLIVERDMFFLERLLGEPVQNPSIIIAKSFKDAISILKRPQSRIRALFISKNFGNLDILVFLGQLKDMKLELPMVLVTHQPRAATAESEVKQMGFHHQLECPRGSPEIINSLQQLFPERHDWQNITATQEKKDQELELRDEEFMPIVTDDFLLTEKCFFNVFIRLGVNKFIKILNAGDNFDKDFAEKYNSKKFSALWVRKKEYAQYTNMSEKNVVSGMQRQSDNLTRRVVHLGDNVSKALGRVGLSDDNLMYADRFLGHSVQFLRLQKMQGADYSNLLNELANAEHPAAVAVIAGLLANQLGFESTKAIKVVGLAALLHDIGIYKTRTDFPPEDAESLSGADLELFQSHAHEGAELLRKMGVFDEVVIQAVGQHHDKHSKQKGMGTNLVGEIVAVADLFCHHVVNAKEPLVDLFLDRQLKDYRPSIEAALRTILKKKPQKRAV